MKLNLFLFLKKAVSHVSVFYVCQPIIFYLFILIIFNLVTVSFDFYLAFTAPDEGEFCLTEILGNKIITLLSCPISLAIGFFYIFYSLAALFRKILFLPLENKIHIFMPPCNILYVLGNINMATNIRI